MGETNIFLIGPMGVGKTTIGRHLARTLDLEFIDSDHEIEERTGADIPWIFDIEGEEGFRERERQTISELVKQQGIVLATGGGAVLDPDSRADLKRYGVVVYLKASVKRLLQRTAKDRQRPLLQTASPRQQLEKILAEREPLYLELADIIVDTEKRNVSNSVNYIIQQVKTLSGSGGGE